MYEDTITTEYDLLAALILDFRNPNKCKALITNYPRPVVIQYFDNGSGQLTETERPIDFGVFRDAVTHGYLSGVCRSDGAPYMKFVITDHGKKTYWGILEERLLARCTPAERAEIKDFSPCEICSD